MGEGGGVGGEKSWTLRKDKVPKFSQPGHVVEAHPEVLSQESIAQPRGDPWVGGSAYHHVVSEWISFQANTPLAPFLLISKHLNPTVLITWDPCMLSTCPRGKPLTEQKLNVKK